MALALLESSDLYLHLMLIVFFVVPLVFTLFSMPYIIRKLKKNGYVVQDMYKKTMPTVPTNGGLLIILVAIFIPFNSHTLLCKKHTPDQLHHHRRRSSFCIVRGTR